MATQKLPTGDIRSNRATWAVPASSLPAIGSAMHDLAPNEPFDKNFLGQALQTTYFDTPNFALRKTRVRGDRYLTLRVRSYDGKAFALSAKTEAEKWRMDIAPDLALDLLGGAVAVADCLPPHLLSRLQEIDGDIVPVVSVACTRYAVEEPVNRFTLDCDVRTDTGLVFPAAVLEWKSTEPEGAPPPVITRTGVRPIKLSKFLWATGAPR